MTKTNFDPYELLKLIKERKPVIHHLTNWVTIYDCANVVKVIGGSPVMAHAPQEVREMAGIASALVLNIGTLTKELIESMKMAAKSANKIGIPVVLDVCGAGATKFRDNMSFELLDETKIDIIKGNASEIGRIAGMDVSTKGVDSAHIEFELVETALKLSKIRKSTVVITGREDIVTDGNKVYIVKNGHPMMADIVGTGCMASSVIGTFAAVEKDLAYAAASALVVFEISSELAAKNSVGLGTYKVRIFDELSNLKEAQIKDMEKVEVKIL